MSNHVRAISWLREHPNLVVSCHTYKRIVLIDKTIYCDRPETLFACDIQKVLRTFGRSGESGYSESIHHFRGLIMESNPAPQRLMGMRDYMTVSVTKAILR